MDKVLFVDDEKMILNSMKRGLRKCEFDKYFASSGKEALRILEQVEINVVVSDMKMPEMSGLELLKEVEKLYPNIVKVIVSGYSHLPQLIATINQANIFKYISKPYDLYGELIPVIKEAIDYARYKSEEARRKEMLESKNNAYVNIFKNMKSKAETKEFGYDLIRIAQQVVLNTVREQIMDQNIPKEEQLKNLDSFKRFMENYLAEIKKQEIYFEPVRIINEVKYMIKHDEYAINIEKGVDNNSKILYGGRGLHIKPVIIGIIEDYIEKETLGTLKIISTEISRDNDKVTMMYLIEGHERLFRDFYMTQYNYKFYKSILNIFGGNIELKKSNDKIDLMISVNLLLPNEGESDEFLDS